MDKLVWHSGLSVGVNEIDNQHKIIFKLINKLMDNKGVFVGSEIISDTLQELREYTEYHFELEEKYMDASNYINSDEHKKRHREFRKKNVEFCFDAADHQHYVPEEIFLYLSEWWKNHIISEDTQYMETFAAHNIK